MKKCLKDWAWVFTICGLCLAAHTCASGPNGTDDGWAIDNNGPPLLTLERATQIAQGNTRASECPECVAGVGALDV